MAKETIVYNPNRGRSALREAAAPATTVTVAAGDTLSAIASAHGVTVAELVAANPSITNPNAIQVGQVINLPGGSSGGGDGDGPQLQGDAFDPIRQLLWDSYQDQLAGITESFSPLLERIDERSEAGRREIRTSGRQNRRVTRNRLQQYRETSGNRIEQANSRLDRLRDGGASDERLLLARLNRQRAGDTRQLNIQNSRDFLSSSRLLQQAGISDLRNSAADAQLALDQALAEANMSAQQAYNQALLQLNAQVASQDIAAAQAGRGGGGGGYSRGGYSRGYGGGGGSGDEVANDGDLEFTDAEKAALWASAVYKDKNGIPLTPEELWVIQDTHLQSSQLTAREIELTRAQAELALGSARGLAIQAVAQNEDIGLDEATAIVDGTGVTVDQAMAFFIQGADGDPTYRIYNDLYRPVLAGGGTVLAPIGEEASLISGLPGGGGGYSDGGGYGGGGLINDQMLAAAGMNADDLADLTAELTQVVLKPEGNPLPDGSVYQRPVDGLGDPISEEEAVRLLLLDYVSQAAVANNNAEDDAQYRGQFAEWAAAQGGGPVNMIDLTNGEPDPRSPSAWKSPSGASSGLTYGSPGPFDRIAGRYVDAADGISRFAGAAGKVAGGLVPHRANPEISVIPEGAPSGEGILEALRSAAGRLPPVFADALAAIRDRENRTSAEDYGWTANPNTIGGDGPGGTSLVSMQGRPLVRAPYMPPYTQSLQAPGAPAFAAALQGVVNPNSPSGNSMQTQRLPQSQSFTMDLGAAIASALATMQRIEEERQQQAFVPQSAAVSGGPGSYGTAPSAAGGGGTVSIPGFQLAGMGGGGSSGVNNDYA